MNETQIEILRAAYDKLDGIDPCGDSYTKLCNLLDSLSTLELLDVAEAKIKFVSALALNRARQRLGK